MKKKVVSRFSVILFVIGLMTAIQYNTFNEPDPRDTRDLWEIRQELSREKQLHSELLSEIRVLDGTLSKYEATSSESPEQALQETVKNLRKQAGLTDVTGPGIQITVAPSNEAIAMGENIEPVPPDLLIRFLNEINHFTDLEISIDGKRIINTTAIRDINGSTTVNSEPLSTPPLELKIVADSMEEIGKIYNHVLGSHLLDEFYIHNLSLAVSEPGTHVLVEGYDGNIETSQLETVGEG